MPTPIELLLDPASLTVLALYGALMLWEALAPARPLPAIPGWKLRGMISFAAYFFLSSYLPLLWGEYLAPVQLLDLAALARWEGAAVGLLAYQVFVYAWHRTMHAVTPLWRAFHQMHHSAERLDTFSAFWFSPLDMIGWTAVFSLSLTLVGLTPEAATMTMYVTTLLSILGHTNVRTPQWLGYFIARPEMHSHHHERGVHARNYADLPVFDMLFGTFYNPREHAAQQGFYAGASRRVFDMLRFRDVAEPAAAAAAKVDARASSISQSRNAIAAGDSVRTLRRGHAR
jgi:sterol desaturase/sphingolipid hydroxylase (fatty acid hydroxylase superfamily)